MTHKKFKLNQRAFTIVELMIATSVLSTMILLVTVMMISIGSLFYKGINQSRTQDDVRTIADQVSQDLKLSNINSLAGPATHTLPSGITVQAYCIGKNLRYSFVVGDRIGTGVDTTPPNPALPLLYHVLWRDDDSDNSSSDTLSSGTACKPIDITNTGLNLGSSTHDPSGTEMIAPNSRLTEFSIAGSSPTYNISVGVAYGDADLLNLSGINSTCRGGRGDQFCSTASLTTTVTQRIPAGS